MPKLLPENYIWNLYTDFLLSPSKTL